MQTVECSTGNSFVIDHDNRSAHVTIISVSDGEVKLAITTGAGEEVNRQTFVLKQDANAEVLELLKSRGR